MKVQASPRRDAPISEIPSMCGKVILITGGTAGIGRATAIEVAKLGGTVVVVGRNKDRGELALAEIIRQSGNNLIRFMPADLSSKQEIHRLANEFVSQFSRLDVLINNAGGSYGRRSETVDRIETTLAINHLCPFLLTHLLLPLL